MVSIDSERNKGPLKPFLEAAKIGDTVTLSECLDKGSDVFEIDESTKTSVLHYAANNGNFIQKLNLYLNLFVYYFQMTLRKLFSAPKSSLIELYYIPMQTVWQD